MKRILAMLLCVIMVVGLLPATAFAADSKLVDAAIFCSDVHGNPSTVTSVFDGIKSADSTFNPSTASFVGDTQCAASSVTSAAQGVFSDVQCYYAFGNHDDEGNYGISDTTGLLYGGDDTNYYIYTISENSMASANPDTSNFTETVAGLDKTKPLFIISHLPLHSRRGDSNGAAVWYPAIEAAAEQMDIFFFWAHNHTSEGSADTAAYYVAKDGTETITLEDTTTVVTPNFTYANAGYIDPPNRPARNKVATAVRIYEDSVNLTVYNASGELSGTYAVNETVTREFAAKVEEVTLSSIEVTTMPTKTEYTVGESFDAAGLVVTATYSDKTTAAVTGYTLSEPDMSTAGTKTVTVTYGEKTVTFEITVAAAEVTLSSIAVTTLPTKTAYTVGESFDAAGLVVTATYSDNTTAAVTGYTLSEPDMSTAGTKAVTVTYEGKTASFDITVTEATENWTRAYLDVDCTTIYTVGDDLTFSKVVLTYCIGDDTTKIYQKELSAEDYTTAVTDPQTGASVSVEDAMSTVGTYKAGVFYVLNGETLDFYEYFDVCAAEELTGNAEGVKVLVSSGVVATIRAEVSVNAHVADAMAAEDIENYVAYDITPEIALKEGNYATISLRIPDGVTNPVAYYVSDDGETVERIKGTSTDGYYSFRVSHFSTYVVGESTEITVPDPETATGSGTTGSKKTVYVLTNRISAGSSYLIVNGNSAGNRYALANNNGNVAATGVTVKTDSEIGTYIELEDATDELWTTSAAIGSSTSSSLKNGDYYLYASSSGSLDLDDSTGNYTNWRLNSNKLYRYRRNYTSYYLRYNNGWSVTSSSSSGSNIYFYVPTEIDTTTTVSGTYSIAGNPAEVTKVVTEGATATLDSILTFQPTSGTATTENPTGVTYTVVEGGDPNGVISGINGSTVTFSGNYGKALVKISYTTSFGEVTNYITVIASEPTYTLDITSGGSVVTGTTIAQKGVTASTTLQLGTQIQFVDEDGAEVVELPEGATIEWHIPEEYHNIATIDHETGLVSFKGVDGAFYVTATLTVGGKNYTVGVNISATTTSYSVPSDGASDFPEYPNEGAIRFDKNATAVGNFSETGIAQVELSMTGVPYTTGSEIDVVMILDMTGSMDDVSTSTKAPTGYTRIDATIAASKAFIKSIVINEDGSYNANRVGIYVFNKDGAATLYDLAAIDTDAKLQSLVGKIAAGGAEFDSDYTEGKLDTIWEDYGASGGTPYDDGLGKAQSVLAAAKTDGTGNDRQQFCVFMTDGVPTSYAYVNGTTYGTHSSASSIAGMLTSASDYATRDTDYKYEYYSTEMKKTGVTVYSVGVGLFNENNAWSGTATQCGNLASALLNDISGPAKEAEQPDKAGADTLSKKDKYFFSVEDSTAATDMKKVFSNIAQKILQAATDVTVEDKITDEYTMIFDIPEGTKDITGVTNDFYIEFGKYALDENHERTTFTSVTKLYLQNTNGVLSAKDSTDPVFEQKVIGEKGSLYYWSTNAADGDSGIYVEVDDTTYYFVSYGMEEAGYNMTSGAYAHGTVDAATNMSNDLVIATPYFVYNAATKMLYWTVDKLDTEEYALRYFLYLENSATEVGTAKETDPGSYQTNEHAYVTYTNFKGKDCRQEFPVPQLTWNGAQVSYVFYLVNAAGQPINKSGQVVDFANATFITDIYTESVTWNKEGDTTTGTGQLSANWLADDLLPDEYEIYDEKAHYALNVYENADGTTIKNQFTIAGGTAAEISASLNNRLELATTTASISTTKVYNTKAGMKISTYGTYTSADNNMKDFDFANTTVAFAVVWQPRLVEDTVVVDFGLDVLINVVQNDILQNTVSGIGVGKDAYGKIAMNTGVSTTSKLGTDDLTLDGNTISIENETSIRFHQGDMQFNVPAVFYYETPVEFWEGSNPTEGYMYSSVTVIPATTVYYEDSFVTYTGAWEIDGTTGNATQAQDRPGASQISAALDADNNYGYDKAYETMTTHSMGSAHKVTVSKGNPASATFNFYGTGFDVISLTDTTTGTIMVDVYAVDDNGTVATTATKSLTVDTYYGYKRVENGDGTYSWVTTTQNDPNVLYQVPVMKVSGLAYGRYQVKITAVYASLFDHNTTTTENADGTTTTTKSGSYDFYLDAVRIYDPCGSNNTIANNAYVADGEYLPTYFELRDHVISKNTFDSLNSEEVSGLVFIDGTNNGADNTAVVSDYTSYGPNNELYLEAGNAVAFQLVAPAKAGYDVESVQIAVKTVGETGYVKIYDADATTATATTARKISTATDMYYDITNLNGKTVVILNSASDDDAIVSITNIKVTYKAGTSTASEDFVPFMLTRSVANTALMSLATVEEDVVEPTTPETTVPEETEPETTVPEETETTVPEETEPEETVPETTVPEETEPEEDVTETITNTIKNVVNKIANALSNLFGRWFR